MTHDEMNGLYELYVLGVLEPVEAAEITQHLADGCPYCSPRVSEAVAVVAAMSGLAEPKQPPAGLRKRVLQSISPRKEPKTWLYVALGMGAACAALVVFAFWATSAMNASRERVATLAAERDQLRSAVEILSRTETREARFGLADNRPHGRVFVNRQQGVVFVGSQLPELASNRTYQLWLVPTAGAPQSVGLFRPNARGEAVNVRTTPIGGTPLKAVAVSVEPEGGSPAPTTTPILVIPIA